MLTTTQCHSVKQWEMIRRDCAEMILILLVCQSLEGVFGKLFHCVSSIAYFYCCRQALILAGSPEGVLVGVSETGSVRVSWKAVENADY